MIKKGIKNILQRRLSTSQKKKKNSNYFYRIQSKAIDILVKVFQIDSNEYDMACHVLLVQTPEHLENK